MTSRRGGARALAAGDVLLLLAVLGLPWWHGGVFLDAMRLAAASIGIGAGLLLARYGPSRGLGLDRGSLWLAPAFALLAFAFLQVVPLPDGIVRSVSPKAALLQSEAFASDGPGSAGWLRRIEAEARARVPEVQAIPAAPLAVPADASLPPHGFRLSLSPDATLERAFWFAALLLAFVLASARAADPARSEAYRVAFFSFFAALAGAALVNRLTSPQTLLWLTPAPEATHPMGPYVNPSHFAGVMELAAPWMLGFGLAPFARRHGSGRASVAAWLALTGAGLVFVAALFSASKTAALTIGMSSLVLIVVAARRGREGRKLIVAASVLGLMLAAIAFAGPLRGRVSDFLSVYSGEVTDTDRTAVWKLGAAMIRDYPIVGSGFGAFREVVPAYLPAGESEHWLQMHNDYLEALAGGGLVAAGLLLWLTVGYARRMGRAIGGQSRTADAMAALGLALGLAALALHEIVDFNLQIPANALLFVTAAGLALGPLRRMQVTS